MTRPVIVVVHARTGDGSAVLQRLAGAPGVVAVVPVGRSMIPSVGAEHPDVVVVDHTPGRFDLVRVCRDLAGSTDAWLMVLSPTRPDGDSEAVRALDAGADVLLPADASRPLVQAYLRVGLRDRPLVQHAPDRIRIGDVVVDLDAHAAFVDGEPVRCPPRQFSLLATLARRPNVAFDHEALIASVWGDRPVDGDPRRLRIAVSLLRSLLGSGPERPRIETVPRVGYRLVVGEERPAA